MAELSFDITDLRTRTIARYIARGFYDLILTVEHRPDFMDEDATMLDKQKAHPRDTKDQDYYFRSLELIPGFPFREFQGASAFKDNADTPNISHHSITQSFLESIKLAPPEIRTNIFAQIPTKRVAEDDALDSFAYVKKSSHLMQDYSTLYDLQFAPVKYSIQVTSKGTFNDDEYLETRDAEVKIPPNNEFFERDFAVLTDITCSKDKEKTMGIIYFENDYPNCFARSYVDFIKFAASLAHSEGFYFENDSSDSNAGIWKSETRESSLPREFLVWFWTKLVSHGQKLTMQNFVNLQNISLDILVMEPLIHTQKYVDGRCVKLFLKKLHNFPNIESLTVFLQIQDTDLADLMHSPGAYRWANALREITFAKCFNVQFKMLKGMSSKEPDCHAVYRRRLRQLLMPECLCYGTTDDVPDHLGIREMSAMEEQ
ncbi:hypothetical protein BCON_0104g00120 [Botryotinia convoluta]|uniref:Uncharacterized protein n=1 Tax=Botryotinia convoluta TaxID=54673 RepID=A0A4Z1HZX5_9HELO|nr:hypothetical protein BCON_0104g00120 [Botryotinia convoluta]